MSVLEVFYNPKGDREMIVSQKDPEKAQITFDTVNGSATLSWHQVRDLYSELQDWLMDSAHYAQREN